MASSFLKWLTFNNNKILKIFEKKFRKYHDFFELLKVQVDNPPAQPWPRYGLVGVGVGQNVENPNKMPDVIRIHFEAYSRRLINRLAINIVYEILKSIGIVKSTKIVAKSSTTPLVNADKWRAYWKQREVNWELLCPGVKVPYLMLDGHNQVMFVPEWFFGQIDDPPNSHF